MLGSEFPQNIAIRWMPRSEGVDNSFLLLRGCHEAGRHGQCRSAWVRQAVHPRAQKMRAGGRRTLPGSNSCHSDAAATTEAHSLDGVLQHTIEELAPSVRGTARRSGMLDPSGLRSLIPPSLPGDPRYDPALVLRAHRQEVRRHCPTRMREIRYSRFAATLGRPVRHREPDLRSAGCGSAAITAAPRGCIGPFVADADEFAVLVLFAVAEGEEHTTLGTRELGHGQLAQRLG
jgi:hypothetical protein